MKYENDPELQALAAVLLGVRYGTEEPPVAPAMTAEDEAALARLMRMTQEELIAKAEHRKSECVLADQPTQPSPLQRAFAAVKMLFGPVPLGGLRGLTPSPAIGGAAEVRSPDARVLILGDVIPAEVGMFWLGKELRIFRNPDPNKDGWSFFEVDADSKTTGAGNQQRLQVILTWADGSTSAMLSAGRPSRTFPESCPSDWHDLRISVALA